MAKKKNNNTLIYVLGGIIGVLTIALAVAIGFLLWKDTGGWNVQESIESFTVITDERCNDGTCSQIDQIVLNLQKIPALGGAEIEKISFQEEDGEEMVTELWITALPAIVFEGNYIDPNINQFLAPVKDGKYILNIQAQFDPFGTYSERGFSVISKDIVEGLQEDSYIKGAENAKILWVEYTDINCFYCQKMEEDGTVETVLEKYPELLQKTTHPFVGVGGAKSQTGLEALECVGKLAGDVAYNGVLTAVLLAKGWDHTNVIEAAADFGLSEANIAECRKDIAPVVVAKNTLAREIFGITGTPGNVLLNTETGEYTMVSGAAPVANFQQAIESIK